MSTAAQAPTTKKTAMKKAAKPPQHPKFSSMIKEAIVALKERNGSSGVAIKKYIIANHKVGSNASNMVNRTIKGLVKKGALVQTKGTGASGSFKMAPKAEKAPKNKAAPKKKPAAKKAPAKKAASKTKAAKTTKSPKKTAAKKAKSPAKKTAKKPAAKKPAAKKTPAKKSAVKK